MDLSNLFSGALGALMVSLLDFLFLRKQGKLEERVAVLETEKFAKLEKMLDEHIKEDVSQTVLTKLDEMEKRASERQKRTDGTLEILTAKVDRALQKNEGQERDIKNTQDYVDNLREDLQNHVNYCNGRRGK